ncbi:hypothetical protein [Glutamicibacter sp. NPDC087344]|uniref:GAP1-N2 domain-containing protein n=1 Tax=Glutamicibacter sp. NPDC087344 TaxID=3363994 RepID=UPI003801765E
MAFETAIYTDVTRDEAIDGTDGFNFQSISSGMDGKLQRQIRESMLHLVSNRWPSDRDDLEHPSTAIYAQHDGVSYFSRGCSVGATHSGRRGNQLTQAIATERQDDLEPYLPAQVYGARNWRMEKAPEQSCSQWFAPLEIDEQFETEALWKILVDNTWALEILPGFLAMLEDVAENSSQKIVLIHDELDTVMRWFALGTMLLGRERALSLGYKAFVTEVFQNSAQLIGVHPDLDAGPLTGAHVINLLEQTSTPIEVTESAMRVSIWAGELDVYEALEVISIAQKWMPVLGTSLGARAAEMVTLAQSIPIGRESWELSLQIIEGLAKHGLIEDLKLYMDELSDAVASHQLVEEDEFLLAARATRFAASSNVDELTSLVLLPSMESLASAPIHAKRWASELDKDGRWAWPSIEEPAQLTELHTEIIAEAAQVEEAKSSLPLLLQLASRLPIRPDEESISVELEIVAELLVEQRGVVTDGLEQWLGATRIKQSARRRIIDRLKYPAGDAFVYQGLLDGRWSSLGNEDLGDSCEEQKEDLYTLRQWIDAAKLYSMPIEERKFALEAGQLRPHPDSWKFALNGAALPINMSLYMAWINAVVVRNELRDDILRYVQSVLEVNPKQAKSKELERLSLLLDSLHTSLMGDAEVAKICLKVKEYSESIPSFMDKAKEHGDRLTGWIKWKKPHESGQKKSARESSPQAGEDT